MARQLKKQDNETCAQMRDQNLINFGPNDNVHLLLFIIDIIFYLAF